MGVSAVRGGDLLRIRRVRQPPGIDVGIDHRSIPPGPPRPPARPGRDVSRDARTEELAVMWDTFRPLRLTRASPREARPARLRLLLARPGALAGRRVDHGKEETMFEEAQLYSPVTERSDGAVTVHLGDDHPGFNDPDTASAATRSPRRRWPGARASRSRGSTTPRPSTRSGAWSAASSPPSTSATPAASSARPRRALDAAADRIPQLDEVTAGLEPLTGFALPARGRPRPAPTSSTARWPTASSTPRSTSATPRRRSTRPSRTSSTRSSATGTCSARPAVRRAQAPRRARPRAG